MCMFLRMLISFKLKSSTYNINHYFCCYLVRVKFQMKPYSGLLTHIFIWNQQRFVKTVCNHFIMWVKINMFQWCINHNHIYINFIFTIYHRITKEKHYKKSSHFFSYLPSSSWLSLVEEESLLCQSCLQVCLEESQYIWLLQGWCQDGSHCPWQWCWGSNLLTWNRGL